jgi:uncharacterized protein DUF6801
MALAVILAVSGIAAGTASASGGHPGQMQAVTATLAYGCRFPSGPQQVNVMVTASLPGMADPGEPIQPAGARLTIAFPRAVIPDLARLHLATVSAVTRLSVDAMDGPDGTSVLWLGATRRAARVPVRGGLVLRAWGRAPSLKTARPGDLTLTAAGLFLMLTPGSANASSGAPPAPVSAGGPDQAPAAPARPAAPAPSPTGARPAASPRPATGAPPGTAGTALGVSCTLATGQQGTLATVPVTGAPARTPRHSTAAVTPKCPKLPPGGLKLNPRFPPPPPPPKSTIGSSSSQGCAFTTGYADVRKLNGAALIQPGLTNVNLFVRTVVNFSPKVDYFEADNAAVLDYHGQNEFPPSTATFLTFGFVPTTATIQLMVHGTVNVFAIGPALPPPCHPNQFQTCVTVATVSSRLSIKVLPGSVKVNGVPLNVGSHCQTASFDAILSGNNASKPPYIVTTGGPITGFVTVPPFTGCGVGENLDPIFNAAISGPQNFNLLTQGPVCFLTGDTSGCDPKSGEPLLPKPLRKVIG